MTGKHISDKSNSGVAARHRIAGRALGLITTRSVSEGFTETLLKQRPHAGLRLIIERKHYGPKNDWAKRWPVYFCSLILLPQNCLFLQRGMDGALAGICGLSLAAVRCCKTRQLNPSLTFRVGMDTNAQRKKAAVSGPLVAHSPLADASSW